MNMWNSVKRRMTLKKAKAVKKKATLFKYKTLAEQDDDGVTTAQIIRYILLVLLAIMLMFPIARAIIKIKRMCRHDASAFDRIRSNKDKKTPHAASNNVRHLNTVTISPSIEKAFNDLNNNSFLNPQQAKHNLEGAIKKA